MLAISIRARSPRHNARRSVKNLVSTDNRKRFGITTSATAKNGRSVQGDDDVIADGFHGWRGELVYVF